MNIRINIKISSNDKRLLKIKT